MGASFLFIVGEEQANSFNEFAMKIKENRYLLGLSSAVTVYDSKCVELAEQKYSDLVKSFNIPKGHGTWKICDTCSCDVYKIIGNHLRKKISQNVVTVFKKLHQHFSIKIIPDSQAPSLNYFDKEQLKIITNNGKNLSATPSDDRERILRDMEIDPSSLERD